MNDQVFQRMCANHVVAAKDLVQYPQMIDRYPHDHLLVFGGTLGSSTALVFWCVEMMETKGWDSDGWDFGDGGKVRGVVMRRT